MATFPQLATGALSQFPLRKRRGARTVINQTADGRSIKLADAAAQTTEWELRYEALSDAELSALEQFFANVEGSLDAFTFVDPCGNLLAWSEDLSESVWQKDPHMALTGGVADPAGGTGAWHVVNSGAGAQSVSQTLNAPAGYVYSFSVYARAAQPTAVTIALGSHSVTRQVGSAWMRLAVSGTETTGAASITFGVQVPAGAAIDVFGPQVEPQAAPSAYQKSTTGGVYENCRFRDDTFSYTSTDVNRHAVTVNIVYANHL